MRHDIKIFLKIRRLHPPPSIIFACCNGKRPSALALALRC